MFVSVLLWWWRWCCFQIQEDTSAYLSNWAVLTELVEDELSNNALGQTPVSPDLLAKIKEDFKIKSFNRSTAGLLELAKRVSATDKDINDNDNQSGNCTSRVISKDDADDDNNSLVSPSKISKGEPRESERQPPATIFDLPAETLVEIFDCDKEGCGILFKFSITCKGSHLLAISTLLNSKPSLAFGKFSAMIRWRACDLDFLPQLRLSFILSADLELAKIVSYGGSGEVMHVQSVVSILPDYATNATRANSFLNYTGRVNFSKFKLPSSQ